MAKQIESPAGQDDLEGQPESAADSGASAESGRQFVTALARGLEVLSAFRPGDHPLSNQEIARRSGLPRPTISRITHTLTELGYLNYLEAFGCYQMGGSLLPLGEAAHKSFQALDDAGGIMRDLALASSANVGIGTRDRLNMLYLVVSKSPSGIGLRFEAGSRVPISKTAMGRAYLVAAKERERDMLVAQIAAAEGKPLAEVQDTVLQALEQYEKFGFCASAGGWYDNVNGIAVPIPWPNVADTLVLNCGAPSSLLSAERMFDEVGPRIIDAARDIGDLLTAMDKARAS